MYSDKVHIVSHPLVAHKLTILRDKRTSTKDFRELVSEIGMLLTYEATRDLPLTEKEVETPICKTMMVPAARVGHIGLYRNEETLEPVKYFCKMPKDVAEREVLIVDPMLATGGSAAAAIGFMKDYGCTSIKLMVLLAAPEGIERVQREHPDVAIYCGAVDQGLNEHSYIVPGLGDAGDRIFGTK